MGSGAEIPEHGQNYILFSRPENFTGSRPDAGRGLFGRSGAAFFRSGKNLGFPEKKAKFGLREFTIFDLLMSLPLDKGVYFVSGIDTDAGKSVATGVIARSLAEEGKRVITQKFIQTGGRGGRGVSVDIDMHRRLMGTGLLPEDLTDETCPVIFSYPASPHLAAALDGREIDFAAIERSTRSLASRYDVVLLEGAGGLHVPLRGLYTTVDYVVEKGLPLILVTSGKLGSINHTLLSLEVCRGRGIEVVLLAYNRYFGEDRRIDEDTFAYLKEYLARYHPRCRTVEIGVENPEDL